MAPASRGAGAGGLPGKGSAARGALSSAVLLLLLLVLARPAWRASAPRRAPAPAPASRAAESRGAARGAPRADGADGRAGTGGAGDAPEAGPRFDPSVGRIIRLGDSGAARGGHGDTDRIIPEDGDENGDGILDARDTELAWRKRFRKRKLGPLNFAEVVLDENDPLVACCPKDAPADAVCLCAGADAASVHYTANLHAADANGAPAASEGGGAGAEEGRVRIGEDGLEELSEEELEEMEESSIDTGDEERWRQEQDWLEKCRSKATKKLLDDRYQLISRRQAFLDNGTKEEDIPLRLQRITMEREASNERERMQEEINSCLVGFREVQLTKDGEMFGSASDREREEAQARKERSEARAAQEDLRMRHNIAALRRAQDHLVEEEIAKAERLRLARLEAAKRSERWVEVDKGRWIYRNQDRPQLPWEQGNMFETGRCSRALIKWGDNGAKTASLGGSWNNCKGQSAVVLPKNLEKMKQRGGN